MEVGRPRARERDLFLFGHSARVDDAVLCAEHGQLFGPRRRFVKRVRRPRVRLFELFHRHALALVRVVFFVLA